MFPAHDYWVIKIIGPTCLRFHSRLPLPPVGLPVFSHTAACELRTLERSPRRRRRRWVSSSRRRRSSAPPATAASASSKVSPTILPSYALTTAMRFVLDLAADFPFACVPAWCVPTPKRRRGGWPRGRGARRPCWRRWRMTTGTARCTLRPWRGGWRFAGTSSRISTSMSTKPIPQVLLPSPSLQFCSPPSFSYYHVRFIYF